MTETEAPATPASCGNRRGDNRCTDGIIGCETCNEWGRVNPKGKRYRRGCKEIPEWAIDCTACHGTAMVACGCRPLNEAELAVIQGRGAEWLARTELDAIETERLFASPVS